MSRLVNDSNVVSIHPRLRKERFVVSNTKQISADYSLMLMFIYLKREALNTRGGSIEARTVCLLMVFLRATIELTWSGIEREGRCHGLFNLHQNPIKPRSPRYAKRETANVNILNNLSILEVKNRWNAFVRDDRPYGSIFVIGPESHHGDFNNIFSTSYGRYRVNRISLFRFRCSCMPWWIDERTG